MREGQTAGFWRIQRLLRFERFWTRSQSIRTAWYLPVEAALIETAPPPAYQQIAARAKQLSRLGWSNVQIASALGVTDKTVAKALAWWVTPG
jgi:hypothetical protein